MVRGGYRDDAAERHERVPQFLPGRSFRAYAAERKGNLIQVLPAYKPLYLRVNLQEPPLGYPMLDRPPGLLDA